MRSKVIEKNPVEAQNSIYGEGKGPPMIHTAPQARGPKRRSRKKKMSLSKERLVRQIRSKNAEGTFTVCDLPGDFPQNLSYRALASYAFLRTMSLPLRLSPFTPNAFLRALYLPLPNALLGEVHVALLRILLPDLQMGYSYKNRGGSIGVAKRRHVDNLRWPLRAGDNLMLLDDCTWPLFFDDYCHLTSDQLYASMKDNEKLIDLRNVGLYPETAGQIDNDDDDLDEPLVSLRTSSQQTKGYGPYSDIIHGSGSGVPKERSPVVMETVDSGSEYTSNDEPEEESDDELIEDWTPKRKYRKRARKSQPPPPMPPAYVQNNPSFGVPTYAPGHLRNMYIPPGQVPPYHHSTTAPVGQHLNIPVRPPQGQSQVLMPTVPTAQTQRPPAPLTNQPHSSGTEEQGNGAASTESDIARIRGGGAGVHGEVGDSSENSSQVQNNIPSNRGQELGTSGPSKYDDSSKSQQKHSPLPTPMSMANKLPSTSFLGPSATQTAADADQIPSNPVEKELSDAEIEQHIRDFLSGRADISNDNNTSEDAKKSELHNEDGSSVESSPPLNHWPQFQAVKLLRSGIPYYRLPLEQKLNILEFLIDQMLCVDAIAGELSRRQTMTGYHGLPYGILPSDQELQNLENQDECAVCDGEGELLCCDGCVASYHRQCIGMTEHEALPEGKWLCPECQLVDPSKFGTLGNLHNPNPRKASLDWFKIDDIQQAIKKLTEVNNQGEAPEKPITQSTEKPEQPSPLDGFEFMIIHGFTFCNPKKQPKTFDCKSLEEEEPFAPMPYAHLGKLLPAVGLKLFRSWPLAQVPMKSPPPGDSFPSKKVYFQRFESFDPTKYRNKYKNAPIPLTMKAGQGSLNPKLFHASFDTECSSTTNYHIADAIGPDVTLDKDVSECLLSNHIIFHDPFQSAKAYMLSLETQLRRACLLDEFWEVGKKRSRSDVWSANVRRCKSVNRLARLFVSLVNQIHCRAFSEAWFHNPHSRHSDSKDEMEERQYVHVPTDWEKNIELRKRTWERTPPTNMLPLLASENIPLERLVDGIITDSRREVVAPRSKRKRRKFNEMTKGTHQKVLLHQEGSTDLQRPSAEIIRDETPAQHTHTIIPNGENNIRPDENAAVSQSELSLGIPLEPSIQQQKVGVEDKDVADHKMSSEVTPASDPPASLKANNAGRIEQATEAKVDDSLDSNEYSQPDDARSKAAQLVESESQVEGTTHSDEKGVKKEDQERSNTAGNSKKRKKRARSRDSAASRGTRRRSGRIQTQQVISQARPLEVSQASTWNSDDLFMMKQIKQKTAEMEKVLKHSFSKAVSWPVAGRIPFDPEGQLSPSEMRRLARKGGTVKATYVEYNTSHEVGHVNFEQMWRKNAEHCTGLEELLFHIRVLESYLDRSAIHSCEGIARRSKTSITKVIHCTQRDPETGVVAHFVVNKNRGRGFWVSSQSIELSSLILDRHTRRRRRLDAFSERMRLKAEEEARELREKQAKAAEEESRCREKRMLEAAEEARRRREKEQTDMNNQNQRKDVGLSVAKVQVKEALDKTDGVFPSSLSDDLERQLDQYEASVKTLVHDCFVEGIFPVPDDRLIALRTKAFPALRVVRDALRNMAVFTMDDECLMKELLSREKKVMDTMIGPAAQRYAKNDSTLSSPITVGKQQNAQQNAEGQGPLPVGEIQPNSFRTIPSQRLNGLQAQGSKSNLVQGSGVISNSGFHQSKSKRKEKSPDSSMARLQAMYSGQTTSRATSNMHYHGSARQVQHSNVTRSHQGFHGGIQGSIDRSGRSATFPIPTANHQVAMSQKNSTPADINAMDLEPRPMPSNRAPRPSQQANLRAQPQQQCVRPNGGSQYQSHHPGWNHPGQALHHQFQRQQQMAQHNYSYPNAVPNQMQIPQNNIQNQMQQLQQLQQQMMRMQHQQSQNPHLPRGNNFR